MSRSSPRVSIAIPAYNAAYFETALVSALSQDCADIEVLVCDDSADGAIEAICERLACDRLRYRRNPRNLGFGGNFTQCFTEARGEFVKFLNDDDVLAPHCVSTMLGAFERWGPGVTLVTSKRQIIDAQGEPQPDLRPTVALAHVTSRMHGLDLGNHVLASGTNVIGEPSTVMFRRADVTLEDGLLFRLHGRDYVILADLCLWLRLLGRGDAVYEAAPLSRFRLHPGQESRKKSHVFRNLVEPIRLIESAMRLGFLPDAAQRREALARRTEPIRLLLQHPHIGACVGLQPAEVEAERPLLEALLRECEQRYG